MMGIHMHSMAFSLKSGLKEDVASRVKPDGASKANSLQFKKKGAANTGKVKRKL
jgi:hypothetical protein